MSENNVIYGINGPVVTIKGETGLSMMEMVYVGEKRLVGEVIRLDKDLTTIQVYEETTGLKPASPGLCYRRRNVRHPRPRNNQKYI